MHWHPEDLALYYQKGEKQCTVVSDSVTKPHTPQLVSSSDLTKTKKIDLVIFERQIFTGRRRDQERHMGRGHRVPKTWTILCRFSSTEAGTWVRSRVSRTGTSAPMGCQCHKHRISLPCHYTFPVPRFLITSLCPFRRIFKDELTAITNFLIR